jgi:hypothetical protein
VVPERQYPFTGNELGDAVADGFNDSDSRVTANVLTLADPFKVTDAVEFRPRANLTARHPDDELRGSGGWDFEVLDRNFDPWAKHQSLANRFHEFSNLPTVP